MDLLDIAGTVGMFVALCIIVGCGFFLLYCAYVGTSVGLGKLRDRIYRRYRAYLKARERKFEAQRRLNAMKWCIAFAEPETKPIRNGANVFYLPRAMKDAK